MLADFDKACGKVGLWLNHTKMMFMKNGVVSITLFTLNGIKIPECSRYVYLGYEVNILNDFSSELGRKKRLLSLQEI